MSILLNASTSTGLGITSDNSGNIEVQSNGTTKLTVASTGVSGIITAATAQASTSGTSIDFTSIPSWAKRITVIFNEVSTNYTGSAAILIQIGSGSVETTGYLSTSATISVSSAGTASSTAGFIHGSNAGANINSGSVVLSNISGNIWIASGVIKRDGSSACFIGGSKTTSGTIDRVRITTSNGTDAFDAGSINIFYEG